ncbi:MAG: hypothetical protein A3C30_01330 [Candidatus Levybacteria bacterium RIFCSPHIGHO2_02_FULL_40_18]|nr:MAG: hypothetical protein A2869_00895 [Candidatus Levybacteria bacterium RIFCSPHIGHO2_01_FULL_40_58]OGH26643.1 MAG: hypothetical protein A3C30_01330 [Candidatus Levybacteria bacterium RIFCSPHIGHO2_02_FULL_40_18]OGH31172.1 MAG: hypothetical protein A3E43_00165 [Candidatus Levybacteria bacterium RIFCSPHIGHO2_12_FULL_40_31]OGH39854.1 MAG: hypothetical protein A2894_03670 [Candidatus Levybacteria bacterium RIFCSPLOWO2_01_FULL_40_64]OGH48878.1 MAG: hypothetical protein A3I54_04775 [Candidatus Lev
MTTEADRQNDRGTHFHEKDPQDERRQAVRRAVGEYKCRNWEDTPREYLEKRILALLNVASLLCRDDWKSTAGDVLIIQLEDIAASADDKLKTKNYPEDPNLFTETIRHLRDDYGIITSTAPKQVFCEAVVVLQTGMTSTEGRRSQKRYQNKTAITDTRKIRRGSAIPPPDHPWRNPHLIAKK